MLNFLTAIDRFGRWILAVLMLLFILTGFGITKNIMDPQLAKKLHQNILPLFFYVLFLVHVVIPLRAKFVQWNLSKNENVSASYAYAIGAILLALCFWLHFR
jgi:cytochrome b subunit of formate dehydrogenase